MTGLFSRAGRSGVAATLLVLCSLCASLAPAAAQDNAALVTVQNVRFVWSAADFRESKLWYDLSNGSERRLNGYGLVISFREMPSGRLHRVMQAISTSIEPRSTVNRGISLGSCYALDDDPILDQPRELHIAQVSLSLDSPSLAESGSVWTPDEGMDDPDGADGDAADQLPDLVVGISAENPQLGFIDDSLQFSGYDVDVLEAVAELMGRSLVLVILPQDGLREALENGSVQMVCSALVTGDPAWEGMVFSESYGSLGQVLLADGESTVNGIKGMSGKRIGLLADSPARSSLTSFLRPQDLISYGSLQEAAADLVAGAIAGVVGPTAAMVQLRNELPELDDGGFVLTGDAWDTVDLGMAVRPDEPDLLSDLNAAIGTLKDDKTLTLLRFGWLY